MADLPPGPELDALVAEKVLGLRLCRHEDCGGCDASGGYLLGGEWVGVAAYSTDIAETVGAAEEARKAGKILAWTVGSPESSFVGKASATVDLAGPGGRILHADEDEWDVPGETPAHALALALLKAVAG